MTAGRSRRRPSRTRTSALLDSIAGGRREDVDDVAPGATAATFAPGPVLAGPVGGEGAGGDSRGGVGTDVGPRLGAAGQAGARSDPEPGAAGLENQPVRGECGCSSGVGPVGDRDAAPRRELRVGGELR